MSSTSSELIPQLTRNTILRAGAGAGKTTTLTQTLMDFADEFRKNHNRFPRIVVTTFTRKATQELKERLLKKSLETQRDDLFDFISSRSQVQISTIHGVLSVFLTRYGSAIGLTPDYKILSETEVKKNARKIIRKYVLQNEDLQELLQEYDFRTLELALLEYFHQSIVFPHLSFITINQQEIATRTLLDHLMGHLRRVATEIASETSNDKWMDYAGEISSFKLLQENESLSDFFSRLRTFWDSIKKPSYLKAKPPFSSGLNEELEVGRKSLDKFLSEACYQPAFWQRHEKNCQAFEILAKSFCSDFMKLKLEGGLLSMVDLETLAFKIIQDSPDSAVKFSQEWDFWMVDEYQDTSPIQVEILRALIGDRPSFVVGDPQQSIYLFRGARSEVFQDKVQEVQDQAGDVQVKLVNYRSSPEVLDFFNHYFTKLSSQFAAMTPDPKKNRSEISEPVVQVICTETLEDDIVSAESLAVVARIQELLKEGVNPEQICVLSRTHRTLEDIAKVAQEYFVPLQLHSGTGFYERREVLDALSILKFLVNPHDNANLVSLLRSPWVFVRDSELINYCHKGEHSYWTETIKQSFAETHPVSWLKSLLQTSEVRGLSWTLRTALIELGVFDYSLQMDSSGRREANLWKVISLLQAEERRPGFNFLDFLDSSLETLSTDEGGEDSDATPVIEPKRVNFMTVHASKGLQFDHVILPGMGKDPRASHAPTICFHETTGQWTLKVRDEGTQSLQGTILADRIVEEIRNRESEEFNRVLYVALTRAKSGVTLLWDQKIGKKSWAAKCPLNLDEGLHEENGFSYLVRRDRPTPKKMATQDFQKKQTRNLWQAPHPNIYQQHHSVTELLDDEVFPKKMKTETESKKIAPSLKTLDETNSLVPHPELVKSQKISAEKAQEKVISLRQAQQGTDAHRIFESMKYHDIEDILEFTDEELVKPMQFLAETEQLPLQKIIKNGHVEWGFTLRHEKVLIEGQIDLWGIIDQKLWLVDYKTGSQSYSEKAFKQLEFYAWALQKMGYLKNITTTKLAVIYPMDQVIKIQELQQTSLDALSEKIAIASFKV